MRCLELERHLFQSSLLLGNEVCALRRGDAHLNVPCKMTWDEGLADLFSRFSGFITPRFIPYILLAGLVTGVCPAQQPAGSSASLPAQNAAVPADQVVLKVGNVEITRAQFETMVKDLEAQQGPATLSRKTIGDNYAELLMLSQTAAASQLDVSPEVVRQLALDRAQILSNAEFASLKEKAKPTAAEISAYYSAHLDDYDTVEVSRVFIWSHAEGSKDGHALTPQTAAALAAQVRRTFASRGDVKKVIDDTPHNPDDVMVDPEPLTFQRGEMPANMQSRVFALKEGEFTELNDAPGTFVFIRVVKRGRRELREVSAQIEKKVQTQKLREELAELRKKTGIWMDEQYFASSKPGPTTESKAPSKPKISEEKDENH